MANPEHLKILKQGVEAWNKWREENPDIKPDLSQADLSGANLSEAFFGTADLSAANLSEADLSEAFLEEADLTGADLSGAKLSRAILTGANLSRAILTGAKLVSTDLRGAHICEANLSGAQTWEVNLHGATLDAAFLSATDLSGADLSGAFLRRADLRGASLGAAFLKGADLRGANLGGADLEGADLTQANLQGANLRGCDLVQAQFPGAKFTGVKLYGTARDDWIIKDVKCKYVYWGQHGEGRSPKDRALEPGEFERLYAALPTIEYIFEKGMSPIDPLIMDRVVQAIRERQPEFDIKIDSVNARGLAPSIKFTVQQEEHKEPALEEVGKGYDERISRLEPEKERLYRLLGQAIDKAGDVKLITAGPGAVVATDGSTINIQQHIHNALELQKAIAAEPEGSKGFAKVAKKTALDIIGEAIKDIAKGQVKEAAKQIIELGKDLGPVIIKTAAYAFFGNMSG